MTECDLFDSVVVNYKDINFFFFPTDLAYMQGLIICIYMLAHLNTLVRNTKYRGKQAFWGLFKEI